MDCANAVHLGCVGDLVSGKLGHVMITGRRAGSLAVLSYSSGLAFWWSLRSADTESIKKATKKDMQA